MWRVSCGSCGRTQACLGVLLALPHSTSVLVLGHTLSKRHGFFGPRPTGLLTTGVLVDGGSVPPQVSTLPSSFVRPSLGSCVRFPSGPSQQSPAPCLRLALSATPRCFPIQTKGMSTSLTRLFGVHDRTTLTCNHTLSPSLFGHTPRLLANCLS